MKFWKSATVSLILARLVSTSASMLWARSCSRHLQYYTNTLYTPAVIHYHGYYINTLYPPAAILQPGGHPGQVPCKLFPADGLLAEQLGGQGQGRLRQLVQHQPPVLVIMNCTVLYYAVLHLYLVRPGYTMSRTLRTLWHTSCNIELE